MGPVVVQGEPDERPLQAVSQEGVGVGLDQIVP
jgi:hypothetical protein